MDNGIIKGNENNSNTNKKKRSQWGEVWRRLRKNKMAMLGLTIIIILILLAAFADIIADYEEVAIKMNKMCIRDRSVKV